MPFGIPDYNTIGAIYDMYNRNKLWFQDDEEWWKEQLDKKRRVAKEADSKSVTFEGEGRYDVDLPGGSKFSVEVNRPQPPAPPGPQRRLTLEERRKRGADSWGYLSNEGALTLPDEVKGPITREATPYQYKALGDAAYSMYSGVEPRKGGRLRKLGPGELRVPDLGTDPLAHLKARNLMRDAMKMTGGGLDDVPMYRPMMEPGGKWVTYGTEDSVHKRLKGKKGMQRTAGKAIEGVDYMDYLKKKRGRRRGRSRRYR